MLFHLAHPFTRGRRRIQVEDSFERLIDRHGDGNFLDCTFKLTFPPNPNGLYLIKGGGSDVWRRRCQNKILNTCSGHRTAQIDPDARQR